MQEFSEKVLQLFEKALHLFEKAQGKFKGTTAELTTLRHSVSPTADKKRLFGTFLPRHRICRW